MAPLENPQGLEFFMSPMMNKWSLLIDYRDFNKIMVKNMYRHPRIEDLLDHLAGAHYFSELDNQESYHQDHMKTIDPWEMILKFNLNISNGWLCHSVSLVLQQHL